MEVYEGGIASPWCHRNATKLDGSYLKEGTGLSVNVEF